MQIYIKSNYDPLHLQIRSDDLQIFKMRAFYLIP